MTDTTTQHKHFGETAIMTPANAITVGRLLLTPYFIYLFLHEGSTWATAGVGALVAFSDGIDGVVARRQGATRSGAFLDPLIDKVVILACFGVVAAKGDLPWAPIVIIAVREVAMTVYRSVVAKQGVSIPARQSAKWKTFVQDFAIAFVCLPPTAHLHWLHLATVWLAAALTVFTFYQYVVDGRRAAPVA
jgi:CDP-diacylglycerol--glycerol-3-phosphate 3-phosphatidyltransferase